MKKRPMSTEEKYLELRHAEVVKANELIQRSRFSLTAQQQKIILAVISQVQPWDDDFKLYEFSIPDFCRAVGIDDDSGGNYSKLKNSIKAIADKSVWVTLDNGKETLLRWIEKPYIDPQNGTVQIKLDRDMKPYLLQIKSNFTRYELLWTLRFKSKYSTRLYELIKSVHYNELEEYGRDFTLDELRKLLGAETYKLYREFRVHVLEPATAEINRYSDKTLTWEPIKRGRQVAAIHITISTKEGIERIKLQDETEKALGMDQLTLWELIRGTDAGTHAPAAPPQE